jgi:hypothetical protein
LKKAQHSSPTDIGFSIVGQQLTYTVADVLSKVVYGVMLNVASTMLSREQGFDEAQSIDR